MSRALVPLIAALGLTSCQAGHRVPSGDPLPTRQAVVLISIDALRWDFIDSVEAPNLDLLVREGVRATGLVPSFPTKTFPNHYSMVTGLFPGEHGIVANNMYDPVFEARFSLSNREEVSDGRWWGGEPVWVTAERQGLVTAALFWPGSEAEISGYRPTFWLPYDGAMPNQDRVQQVLDWLALPSESRPYFSTLYFSDVDDVAHRHDISEPQVKDAIRRVDRVLGLLLDGIKAEGWEEWVNLIVVSDHGMAEIDADRVIFLDDYLDLDSVRVSDLNPVAGIWPTDVGRDRVLESLRLMPHVSVYAKEEIPERFHYRRHRRVPPVIAVADEGWTISLRTRFDPTRVRGMNHGFDNHLPSMAGTFIAWGPAFRDGLTVGPFQNVHIYELMCAVLGIEPAPNSGSLDSVAVVLEPQFR